MEQECVDMTYDCVDCSVRHMYPGGSRNQPVRCARCVRLRREKNGL